MRCVAFLRNVNQGQSGHPSTDDLVSAFADVGCPGAVPFQSNGTVVFGVDDPKGVADDIRSELATRGYDRACFTLPLDVLSGIAEPFAGAPDADRTELTLHAAVTLDLDDPHVTSVAAHRRCRLVAIGDGWTVSVNERPRESNATPVIERLTDAPATSRSLRTVLRLVDTHAPRAGA